MWIWPRLSALTVECKFLKRLEQPGPGAARRHPVSRGFCSERTVDSCGVPLASCRCHPSVATEARLQTSCVKETTAHLTSAANNGVAHRSQLRPSLPGHGGVTWSRFVPKWQTFFRQFASACFFWKQLSMSTNLHTIIRNHKPFCRKASCFHQISQIQTVPSAIRHHLYPEKSM